MINSQKRIPQLDLLRAVAVLLVAGNHMVVSPPGTNFYVSKIVSFWNRGGWVGVDLFFVLSGFLVSGLLFREYQKKGDLNFRRFLIRRGFKVYPSLWFLIAATLFAGIFTNINFYGLGLFGEIFFVQNYAGNLWEHTWTLAVEEHFYITLCVLFYWLLRNKKKADENPFASIPRIFAFIAIACFVMRLLTVIVLPFSYERNIEPTHLRIDSLFFGVFISYFWHFKNLSENAFLKRNRFPIAATGALLLLPAFVLELDANIWIGVFGLPMFYLGSGLLLVSVLKSDFSNSRFVKPFAYIGTFSYSIYLWNIPVQKFLTKAIIDRDANYNWFLYFAVYISATLIVGIGMSKIIEYPFLRIRNRYFPSQVAPLVQTAERQNFILREKRQKFKKFSME